jgi:D-3-phosphoglycerate dehydrogenase / 2-oxoglutarate reductase
MKIVVTEPQMLSADARSALAALGDVSFGPFDDRELRRQVADCDVLMVRLGRFIDEPLMREASNLRFIVTATTGLDHVDLNAAGTRNIRVVSLRDCPDAIRDVSATAEHTWGLLLALLRRIPAASAHVLDGSWDRNLFWGKQLKGKRLGIVGHGRIGAMVARYGDAFGMDVFACDTDRAKIQPPAKDATFAEILGSCDVVSIHATASPENRNLIDRARIAEMKADAILINTARGSLVDEMALAEAVASGRLGGAAVDVLDGEEHNRIAASPLLACARDGGNVIVTPHIGGATVESLAQAEMAVIAVLQRVLAGNPG